MSKAERQYLERYAEPEAVLADRLGTFGHAIVLPAYGEGEELIEALRSVPAGPLGDVLVILVVNGRERSPDWVHRANGELAERIQALGREEEAFADPSARLISFARGRILLVDRASPGRWLPEDQGVGLARKLGSDIGLRLHAAGRLLSPFLHSTDADVELPPDYFARPELTSLPRTLGRSAGGESAGISTAALLYPFTHRPEEDVALAQAILLYELSLRYYVLGLHYAGSRYAYHTIGSTLAIDFSAYAMVRGFPKRTAGEDFYLLSKLAKVGSIGSMQGEPIALRGRPSDRVPFGTGPAVRRIAAAGGDAFVLYHPTLFEYLRAWLAALASLAPGRGDTIDRAVSEECRGRGLDPGCLQDALRGLDAFEAVERAASESKDREGLARRMATWFDAFRTLKLLHALEGTTFPKMRWSEALQAAAFTRDAVANVHITADLSALGVLVERLAKLSPDSRYQIVASK